MGPKDVRPLLSAMAADSIVSLQEVAKSAVAIVEGVGMLLKCWIECGDGGLGGGERQRLQGKKQPSRRVS